MKKMNMSRYSRITQAEEASCGHVSAGGRLKGTAAEVARTVK
jgi:hypothetical protein